jgi:hypothetical protein
MLQKNNRDFICEKCDYITRNKNNFEKHLLTRKHKDTTQKYNCVCGKSYPYRASLFNHKKKCTWIKEPHSEEYLLESLESTENTIIVDSENIIQKNNEESPIVKLAKMKRDKISGSIDYHAIIMQLIDQNADFKNLLIKQQEQIGDLIPRIGNNNTNIKQKFNFNIFLNEQCRDAVNMKDFVDKIEVSMENLLTTRDKGLSEGLTNVFIENMNKLPLNERPMHCTDIKRETLYIKDNDVWEKDSDKSKIKAALKDISITQFKSVKKWMDSNPGYEEDEKKQEQFISLIRSCSSSLDNVNDKIIRRLCNSSYLKDKLE